MRSRGAEAKSASSVKVPSGPRNATRRRPALAGDSPAPARSVALAPFLACQGALNRLPLLRGKLQLRVPVAHAFDVGARLLSVKDRGHHDTGPGVVEQGQRAGLLPAHLVVGVVANH